MSDLLAIAVSSLLLGAAVGGWVQRAADSRRFRRIGARAERMGP